MGLALGLWLRVQLQRPQTVNAKLLVSFKQYTLRLHLRQGQGAMLGRAHFVLCCWDELSCWSPQWWWVAWLW